MYQRDGISGLWYSGTEGGIFKTGVDSFITTARAHISANAAALGYIHCPCRDCKNLKQFQNAEQIHCHLLCRGFMPNYQIWNKHGENLPEDPSVHSVRWSGTGSTQPACQHETVLEGDTTHPAGDDSVLPEDDVGHEGTLVDEDAFDALDQMILMLSPKTLMTAN